jgi:hypothetical protein
VLAGFRASLISVKFRVTMSITMPNASLASEEPSGTLTKSLWMTRICALVMVAPLIVGSTMS